MVVKYRDPERNKRNLNETSTFQNEDLAVKMNKDAIRIFTKIIAFHTLVMNYVRM